MSDSLPCPKADALPGCATPRLAEALGKPADLGNPSASVRGNARQNEARTGSTNHGLSPNRESGAVPTWSKLEPLAKWTAVTVLAICTTALVLCGRGEASFMGIMLLMAVIWETGK